MRARLRMAMLGASVTLSLVAPGAHAAAEATAVDASVAARAGELFKAGRAAAAAGDNKTACQRFSESEQLQPAPGTQLNLGACEEKQGHLLAAREHFRKAASAFGPEDRRRAVAANSASTLTDRLAVLTVHVPATAAAGLAVTVEGAPMDPATLEHGIELDPGSTKVVVTASGRQPRALDLTLAEAEKRAITAEAGEPVLADEPVAPVVHEDATGGTRGLPRTLGFVGIGVGAAGLLAGGVFGGLALHEASVVKANCNTTTWACKAPGVSAASSGQTDGVVSTVGFVAGAAFAAAGIYLVIRTNGPSGGDHATRPIGVVLTPMASPRGGEGVAGTWSF